jgi:hypothetical protein
MSPELALDRQSSRKGCWVRSAAVQALMTGKLGQLEGGVNVTDRVTNAIVAANEGVQPIEEVGRGARI